MSGGVGSGGHRKTLLSLFRPENIVSPICTEIKGGPAGPRALGGRKQVSFARVSCIN